MRSPPWRPEKCLLEGDLGSAGGSRRPRAPAGSGGRQGRRRGRGSAGSPPAARRRPGRGASQEPVAPALRALALELLDELDAMPRPLAAEEPDGFDEILAAGRSGGRAGRRSTSASGSPAPGSAARSAACSASRSRTSRARGSARSREATGNWPVAGWFTAEGLPEEVSERWPWNRASRPTSLAENIDGIPEDDDLNFTMLGVALLERCGTGFDALDVAKIWLDYMPPGRIFTAERVAVRNLLEAYLPPETATRRNPFREWIGARLRVDAYGWAAAGDPVAAARMAWEDARVSHTANGVYAAMFMAAAHAASLSESSAAACADAGLSVVPARSRLAEALRTARDLARRARVGGRRRRALRALPLPLGARDQQHGARRRGALRLRRRLLRRDLRPSSRAGSDTDTNGAAVGSILGALAGPGGIEERWSAPLQRTLRQLAAGLRRDHARRARAADARRRRRRVSIPLEKPRDPWSPRPIDLPTPVPLEPDAELDGLDAAKIFAAPDDPADWPAWREALTRWRAEAAERVEYDDGAYRAPEFAWTRGCFSVALVWLWDELLYDHEAGRFTPERFCAESEREFGGFDGIVLWHAYPGDRDRRAQPVRLLPGRAGDPRARRRAAGARPARLRQLQPLGRRDAPRAGRGRRRDRGARARARRRRRLPRHDEGGAAGPPGGARRACGPGSRSKASRRCRSRASATTTSRGRSGSPTAPSRACCARAGSSSATCSTTRAAGTATTPRSCTAPG